MKKLLVAVISALALLPLSGCLGGGTIACDFRDDDGDRCQERSGIQAANPPAFQATCEASTGSYIDGPCPREGIVAGCDTGSGEVIDWYYAPTTEAEVMATCEGTFVLP